MHLHILTNLCPANAPSDGEVGGGVPIDCKRRLPARRGTVAIEVAFPAVTALDVSSGTRLIAQTIDVCRGVARGQDLDIGAHVVVLGNAVDITRSIGRTLDHGFLAGQSCSAVERACRDVGIGGTVDDGAFARITANTVDETVRTGIAIYMLVLAFAM